MNNIEGTDTCMETSVFEYGLAWILSDCKTEYKFYYGITKSDDNDCNELLYNTFDFSFIQADIDVYKEFDWIDFNDIYAFTGQNKEIFDSLQLPLKIYDIVSFHGPENVFGTSYTTGFKYLANINRFQSI
jgi:hypothetical protein